MNVMHEAVEQLHQAVNRLLEIDLDTLDDPALHELAIEIQTARSRLGGAAAAVLSRWDQCGVWALDGSLSAAQRLARDTRCSVAGAKVELRRARGLRTMPATACAVAEGALSLDHVDLLGRANQPWRAPAFADYEPLLVEECSKLRFAEAAKVVQYWCQRADAIATEESGERQQAAPHLYASPTLDGTVVVTGELDAVGGAIVTGELGRLEHALYLADKQASISRTPAERRAAALVEMATRSATAPESGRRPKPLFTVLLGDTSFSRLCELANGTVLTPERLGPWLDDAVLETVLFDGPTTVVSVSRRRGFVGALRRAIEVRDRHCQHPSGCDVPADRCDVDLIIPVAAGGPTSQFNGRIECHPHNRDADKHDHGADPYPSRPITRLDELRARLRWRYRNDYCEGDASDEDGPTQAAG